MKDVPNEVPSSPAIGTKRKFYGHVIGLNIDPWTQAEGGTGRLLVTFQNKHTVKTWEVPDLHLWGLLWRRLQENARHRHEWGELDQEQVYIEKGEDGWSVALRAPSPEAKP